MVGMTAAGRWKLFWGRRVRHADSRDVLERLESAALKIVPSRHAAAVLATEMAVFYYAFGAWRRRADAPPGSLAFSIHRQSGVAALFGMLAGVTAMEAALVHVLVTRWSPLAARVLTALSAYGIVWLVAMSRAFALRPVLVCDREVVVRSGMMWTVRVPVMAIAATLRQGPFDMKMPPACEPNVVLRLAEPVVARGMHGVTRRVASVAIAVDDREAFERAIAGATAAYTRRRQSQF
jgi:hypothetical protein